MSVSARIVITNTTITKARSDVRPGMKRYEIRDTKATGLIINVQPSGLQWQYRFQVAGKSKRLILGSVDLWTVAEAREIAGEAMAFWKSGVGIPDEQWLQRRMVQRGKVDKPTEGHQDSRHAVKWSFARAREEYLQQIQITRSRGTYNDYRQKLQSQDLKVLDGRPVASISRIEMSQLIAGVHKSGRESTAESLVRIVGAFWRWLGEDNQTGDSGVSPDVMKRLKAPDRTRAASKRLVEDPSLEDLGRIVAIARSGAVDVSIGCAIELVVWSCQRRRAVASAHELDFRATADGTEGLWFVFADDRKRSDGDAHVIPLPAPAWACVQRAIKAKAGSKSPFLFPQFRPRRAGGDIDHLHESTITHVMSFMPGVTSSPHHIRSVFGTYGEAVLGFLRSETKTIESGGAKLVHGSGGIVLSRAA